jgi:hypothetical protein
MALSLRRMSTGLAGINFGRPTLLCHSHELDGRHSMLFLNEVRRRYPIGRVSVRSESQHQDSK